MAVGPMDNPAKVRWSFALQAVLHRIRCKRGILDTVYCAEKLGMIRKTVAFLKHQKVIGPIHAHDEFAILLIEGATRYLPPSDVHLCRWLAQTGYWPTVHLCVLRAISHVERLTRLS